MVVKTGLCVFSGFKIYPGRGIRYIRIDGRSFTFVDSKNKRNFIMRRNPRKEPWTVVYRRVNKKGITEEIAKKKTKKVQKVERGVVGASLEAIRQKRNQKPEVRAAAREAAERELKEKKAALAAKRGGKPAAAGAKAASSAKGAPKKVVPASAPPKSKAQQPSSKGR